jgi:hypothetical protein
MNKKRRTEKGRRKSEEKSKTSNVRCKTIKD